jgi:hypothetical protein
MPGDPVRACAAPATASPPHVFHACRSSCRVVAMVCKASMCPNRHPCCTVTAWHCSQQQHRTDSSSHTSALYTGLLAVAAAALVTLDLRRSRGNPALLAVQASCLQLAVLLQYVPASKAGTAAAASVSEGLWVGCKRMCNRRSCGCSSNSRDWADTSAAHFYVLHQNQWSLQLLLVSAQGCKLCCK